MLINNAPLISTIATGLGLSLVLGFLCVKCKLPALVGYLLAGIVIGPFTPGFVANTAIAAELAEIGIMLLMFGVGLHFSLKDLLSVSKIAIPGAILQILVATVLGAFLAVFLGWNFEGAFVFGLALSVASTVVLLRALETRGILESLNGRIAVGWLIVEDLVMVLVLVLLPSLSLLSDGSNAALGYSFWYQLAMTLCKVVAFIAFMLLIGKRIFPALLWQVARLGSRELFTLCVVSAALGIAYAATELFGISFALGAFFAGVVMRESEFSHRAAEESLPLREAFAVLFFVSVGMLFDPRVLVEHPFQILCVLGIIIIGKSVAASFLVLLFRYPLNTALTVSASLAQIGEFSFILAGLGVKLQFLPPEAQSLIVAGALISIAINPLLFASIKPLQSWIESQPWLAQIGKRSTDHLSALPIETTQSCFSGQVVLVGYGRVGRRIAKALSEKQIIYIVVEQNRDLVRRLREQGIPAVCGNASEKNVLIKTHINQAKLLIIATPDTFDIRKMIDTARLLNPKIEVVVRTHNESEADLLKRESIEGVFFGEAELANGMIRYVLESYQIR